MTSNLTIYSPTVVVICRHCRDGMAFTPSGNWRHDHCNGCVAPCPILDPEQFADAESPRSDELLETRFTRCRRCDRRIAIGRETCSQPCAPLGEQATCTTGGRQ